MSLHITQHAVERARERSMMLFHTDTHARGYLYKRLKTASDPVRFMDAGEMIDAYDVGGGCFALARGRIVFTTLTRDMLAGRYFA